MLNDLNKIQRVLAEYMSDLSDEAYATDWMAELEFDLWEALEGKIKVYGRLEICEEILRKLRRLSDEANGWIYFHNI